MHIKINEDTLSRIKGVLEKQPDGPGKIRVYLAGIGWGGPRFGLGLDQEKEDDVIEHIDGVDFVLEQHMIDSYGQFEIGWTGFGYQVGPLKGARSRC